MYLDGVNVGQSVAGPVTDEDYGICKGHGRRNRSERRSLV